MNCWGYGVILISRDLILRLVPLFSRRWWNCTNFCQIFDDAPIWRVVITKRLNIQKRKIFFQKRDNRATFWWKMGKSSFTNFWQTVADALGVLSLLPLAMRSIMQYSSPLVLWTLCLVSSCCWEEWLCVWEWMQCRASTAFIRAVCRVWRILHSSGHWTVDWQTHR